MAKDINIHLKAHGAERTKQQLEGVGQSAKKTGDSAGQGGKTGADGLTKMSDAAAKGPGRFARLSSSIKSWVFGLVGIAAVISGITRAIQIQKQAIEEHARIASEHQKKLLALQTMGTIFEEHPDLRDEITSYAEAGRRTIPEVTEAYYTLESKGAGLTESQKEGIMKEALELGRMEPEADLKGIVELFSLYAKESGEKDINKIQNVLRETMTKAGADLSGIAQYLPEFLSLGITGGLPAEEVAGLWAYATTRTKEPAKATVGIRNIFTALLGKGTPESQKIKEQMGITPEMDFYKQIEKLSEAQRTGKFGVPEAEAIAGKENIAVLLSMLTNPQAMMQSVREVSSKARSDIDIVKSKLDLIMSTDEVARLEEEGRRLDVAIEGIKGQDVGALQWGIALKEYEKRMREAGISELVISMEKLIEGLKAVLGLKPGEYEIKFGPLGGRPVEFPRFNPEGEILPETKTKPEPTFFRSFPFEPPPTEETPTIPPISKKLEVPVPVEPVEVARTEPVEVARTEPVEVPVEVVAAGQKVQVPVELDPERVGVSVPAPPAEEKVVAQTTNNFNYNYDHSLKFYPRVGSDESGPRVAPGVMA